MFDPRSGALVVQQLPLGRLGLMEKWPKLGKLQDEVASLDKRRQEAESAVVAAKDAVPRAKELDATSVAKALRSGKAMPEAKAEAKAQAALDSAERTLAAFTKATADAAQDLEQFKAKHRDELLADLTASRRENASEMARLAPELSSRYARDFELADLIKKLAPPATPAESDLPARSTTTFIGVESMQTVAGVPRGTVEQVLTHLASLEQFATVVGDGESAA
jgi:hypothetical protein